MISTRPNTQRRAIAKADLYHRRKMLSAHLSKELKKQYKRRSMSLRKGDEVKIIKGEYFGKVGEVTGINLKKQVIFVNNVVLKKTVGTEKQAPIKPSNIVITSLKLDDPARQRILLRKVKEVVVPKKEEKKVEPETKLEHKTEIKIPSKSPDHAHGDHLHDSSGSGNKDTSSHVSSTEQMTKTDDNLASGEAAPKNAAGKGGN
jgi:large subunit ribosomal protein L24